MKIDKSILNHLKQDARLKKVIESTPALQIKPGGTVYSDLVKSIVSQQLSVKAADTIFQRLLQLFGGEVPPPEDLTIANISSLRNAGISNQKAAYLKNVAHYFNTQATIDWGSLSDEAIVNKLTQIKGVGIWTAEMILIFTLQREDVFPVGDLGIRQAMTQLYEVNTSEQQFHEKLRAIAKPWSPYRSIASRYLWHWKDTVK